MQLCLLKKPGIEVWTLSDTRNQTLEIQRANRQNLPGSANPVQMEHKLHFHRSEEGGYRRYLHSVLGHKPAFVWRVYVCTVGSRVRNAVWGWVQLQTLLTFLALLSWFPTSLAGVSFCSRGIIITGIMINRWRWSPTTHIFVWLSPETVSLQSDDHFTATPVFLKEVSSFWGWKPFFIRKDQSKPPWVPPFYQSGICWMT